MCGESVKKIMDRDPQEARNDGGNVIDKVFIGGLTKAFMDQEFVDKINNAMDQGQAAIDMHKNGQMLAISGLETTAKVLGIEDTGALINMNLVVRLNLKVAPPMGMPGFETTGQTTVSKIAIPRKGETIKTKHNPANPSESVVVF